MIIYCIAHVFKSCPWIITSHGFPRKNVPGNPWFKDMDSDSSIGTISWWLQPQLHPVKCKHVISHNQYHWMLLLYNQLVSDHQPLSSHFRRCWGTLLLGLLPASGSLLPTKGLGALGSLFHGLDATEYNGKMKKHVFVMFQTMDTLQPQLLSIRLSIYMSTFKMRSWW